MGEQANLFRADLDRVWEMFLRKVQWDEHSKEHERKAIERAIERTRKEMDDKLSLLLSRLDGIETRFEDARDHLDNAAAAMGIFGTENVLLASLLDAFPPMADADGLEGTDPRASTDKPCAPEIDSRPKKRFNLFPEIQESGAATEEALEATGAELSAVCPGSSSDDDGIAALKGSPGRTKDRALLVGLVTGTISTPDQSSDPKELDQQADPQPKKRGRPPTKGYSPSLYKAVLEVLDHEGMTAGEILKLVRRNEAVGLDVTAGELAKVTDRLTKEQTIEVTGQRRAKVYRLK